MRRWVLFPRGLLFRVDEWIAVKASTSKSAEKRKLDELKETPTKGISLANVARIYYGSWSIMKQFVLSRGLA
jgi:hypothetical protein